MADETTTLLIDVKVSADEAIKRQQDLKIAIEAQRSAISELTKEKKGAELAEAKLSEDYIIAESNLKNLNSQLGANQRVLTKMQGDVVGVSGAYAALNQKSAEAAQLAKDMSAAYGPTNEKTIEAVKSAKDLSDQLKAVDAATGQFVREVGNYENGTKSLRAELKEIVGELGRMKLAGQENSDEYRNLSARGGELKDTLTDISTELQNVGSDTRGIDQVVGAFTALGAAAQVAEGAQALLGTESEAVQESIQKMVAIQSVMNGVQEIGNALQKESTFMMGLMAVKSKVLAGWKITLTTLEKIFGVTAATSMALATAGITVLISGIILLIANFNSIIASLKSFFGVADKFKDTKKDIDANTKALDGFTDATNRSIDRMKAMGKSEQEILNEKKKRFNEELRLNADTYNKIKKLGDDATDEQKEQLKKSYDFVKNAGNERYKLETEQIALTRSLNQKAAEDAKKLEEEKNKKVEDGNKKRAENNKKRLENEQKAEDDRLKQLKENADKAIEILTYEIEMAELKEQQRLANQKLTDAEIHSNKIANLELTYTDEKKRLDILLKEKQISQQKYDDEIKLANQKKNTDISIENAAFEESEAQRKKERQAIEAQAEYELQQMKFKNEFDAQQNALDVEYQQKIEAAKKIGADTVALEAIYAEQSKQIAEVKKKAQLDVASSLAGNLAELFGKETNLGKAAASAQVAIQTYQGAMSAWTAAQVFPAPFNAIVGGASVAATVALGAKSVKDIWAVKAPGASGGSSSAASVSTPSASVSAASVTGGLVSRSSGQTEQAATTQAMDKALKDNNTTKTVLVTNDLTTALNEKVQLQNDNGL